MHLKTIKTKCIFIASEKKNIQTRQNLKPATQKIFLIATTGTFENVHKYMLFHASSAV